MSWGALTSEAPSVEPKKLITSTPKRSRKPRTTASVSGAEPEPTCRRRVKSTPSSSSGWASRLTRMAGARAVKSMRSRFNCSRNTGSENG